MNIFKKLAVGAKLTLMRLSIGLSRVEEDILTPKELTDTNEKNNHNIKAETRNPIARKMQQGVKDEKFVKEYYELLKKSDEFMETADPEKIAQIAVKRRMTLGLKLDKDGVPIPFKTDADDKVIKNDMGVPQQKDEFGRRYDNYGFFDPKHKHYGKTIREVTLAQVDERKLKDDDFPIEYMINNTPIVEGIIKGAKLGQMSIAEQAKHFKFPLKIISENTYSNNIIELTEFLHVKRIDEKHRILEFFIPKKFKLGEQDLDSKIMKELLDFQQIWHKEKYGEMFGFSITSFFKRVETDKHDIIKFNAKLIEKLT